ncbi:MAG: hypothetical protein DRR42_07355 [Gammaproteobacteria bacterium]|nr:MAG: hypothetical protein DRR42_07355 [Gammaproteobacteria bacterium]
MNSSNLIATKLIPPQSQLATVNRQVAMTKLGVMGDCKFTIIHAPAGYGKTTLMRQWFDLMGSKKERVCWLSLDQSDCDSSTFLRYLIAALRTHEDQLGSAALSLLDNAVKPDISLTLAKIINELSQLSNPIRIFIDDYHVIDNDEIHRFIDLLLNLAPAQLKIIIATRKLPPFSLSSLRITNNLCEITEDTLRFDLEECKNFVRNTSTIQFNEEQLEILHRRTEGWVAGLQLAISSQKKSFDVEMFINTFSGRLTDIAEYLAYSVLKNLDARHGDFLICTSVLDSLNVELCNAVLEREDSQLMLENLIRNNLFVFALDNERKWYRYHHLFQQFLVSELQRQLPGVSSDIQRRASLWCAAHGNMQMAVDYALRAGDMSLAITFIEERAAVEFSEGNMPKVCEWIYKIPPEVRSQHPKVLLLLGTALFHVNQPVAASVVLNELKLIHAQTKYLTTSNNLVMDWEIELRILAAGIKMSADQHEEVISLLGDTKLTPNPFSLGIFNNIKAYAHTISGELDLAEKHHDLALTAHHQSGSEFGLMYAYTWKAMTHYWRGNIKQGLALMENHEVPHFANPQKLLFVTPIADFTRGLFYFEMNQLEKALQLLVPNIEVLESCGHISLLQLGYATLARIHVRAGEYQQAFNRLNHLLKLQHISPEDTHHPLFVAACKVDLFLRTNQHVEALKISSLLNIPLERELICAPTNWNRELYLKYRIQTQLLIATKQLDDALANLQLLSNWTLAHKQGYRMLNILILKSKVENKLGDFDAAEKSISTAIGHAAPNNMLSVFLEDAKGIEPIIKRLHNSFGTDELTKEFIELILNRPQPSLFSKQQQLNQQKISMALLEPLSKRELEILSLMALGKSNSSIGEALFISLDTVKWHNKNIFGKLNVRNRTEATISALEMNLITNRA